MLSTETANSGQIQQQLKKDKGFGLNLIRIVIFGALITQNVHCDESTSSISRSSKETANSHDSPVFISSTRISEPTVTTPIKSVVVVAAEPYSDGGATSSTSTNSNSGVASSSTSATMSVSSSSTISSSTNSNQPNKVTTEKKNTPTIIIIGDKTINENSWSNSNPWTAIPSSVNVTEFMPMPMPNTTPLTVQEQEKRISNNKKKQQQYENLITKDKQKYNQKKKGNSDLWTMEGVRKQVFKYGRMLMENFINGVATSAISSGAMASTSSSSSSSSGIPVVKPAKKIQAKVNDPMMSSASSVSSYTNSAFGHFNTPASSASVASSNVVSQDQMGSASSFAPTAPIYNDNIAVPSSSSSSSGASLSSNSDSYYGSYSYGGGESGSPNPKPSPSYFGGDGKSVVNWLSRLIGVSGKTLGEFLREYQVHVLYDLVFTFFKWIFFLYAGLVIP